MSADELRVQVEYWKVRAERAEPRLLAVETAARKFYRAWLETVSPATRTTALNQAEVELIEAFKET
jgi:hypothetical protein